ncbi:hypothetical protein F4678DRAFT_434883 [Xylaria arbuscula]|nr:hypothetical protein F4678DRAFT_434883 [Xylaria arbuscula]
MLLGRYLLVVVSSVCLLGRSVRTVSGVPICFWLRCPLHVWATLGQWRCSRQGANSGLRALLGAAKPVKDSVTYLVHTRPWCYIGEPCHG